MSQAAIDEQEAWLARSAIDCKRWGARLSPAACEQHQAASPERCKGCERLRTDGVTVVKPQDGRGIFAVKRKVKPVREKKKAVKRLCKVDGCDRWHWKSGYCWTHHPEKVAAREAKGSAVAPASPPVQPETPVPADPVAEAHQLPPAPAHPASPVTTGKQPRPKVLSGRTHEQGCGCGRVYVTVNRLDGRVVEVFARLGKSGGCGAATMEAVGRLLSAGLRCGVDAAVLIKQVSGIQCHRHPSCLDAVAEVLKGEVEEVAQ